MALAMIEQAEARGALRPGMTVVEYTGGSTGSSLAFVCAVKGYRVKIVCSDAFAQAKLDTIRAFGAELVLVPSDGGRITPDLIPRMIDEARRLAEADDVYWTNQLYNEDGLLGGAAIGRELLEQVDGGHRRECAPLWVQPPCWLAFRAPSSARDSTHAWWHWNRRRHHPDARLGGRAPRRGYGHWNGPAAAD